MIGQTVSHYKIVERLGEGGMGVVYKAEDTKLKRTVALKFLPKEITHDQDAKTRFVHEAQAASALDHTNICTVYEIDESSDHRLFICMAYYRGETLIQKIERRPLKLDEALNLAIQIASGMKKAHEQGIVHRDIKPANIIVTEDGVAKIVDFGLAKLGGRTKLTKDGTTLGTVAYMSPEQVRGNPVDQRSDIWSLGAVLYEMIAGRPPFCGDFDQAVMYSITSESPEPLTGIRTNVPPELERIVNKCLAKDQDARYQHADDLIVDLKLIENRIDSTETRKPARGASRRSSSSIRLWVITAGAVIAIATAAYFVIRSLVNEPRAVGEPTPVAIISFENRTGEAQYDYLREAIPNLLITSLERSPLLRVVTWERLHDLRQQIGKTGVGVIDEKTGFELCRAGNIGTIVLGSFTKAGNAFVTDVKVLEVSSKRLVKAVSASGDGVESILKKQIDELGESISQGIGVRELEPSAEYRPISEVTTTSMEAYNYYLRGTEAWRQFNYSDSQEYLRKAIGIDSTFAMAYLYLGFTYRLVRDRESVRNQIKKAVALSDHTTAKERLIIDMYSSRFVEEDPEKAHSILIELLNRYPDDKLFHYDMGVYYHYRSRYAEAIEELRKAIALDPSYGKAVLQIAYSYANIGNFDNALEYARMYESIEPGKVGPKSVLAEMYYKKGDIDRAIVSYKEALAIEPDLLQLSWKLAYLLALKEDYPGCIRYIDEHIQQTDRPQMSYRRRGFHRAWQGDYAAAIRDLDRARELYESAGDMAEARDCQRWKVWTYYDKGDFEASRSALAGLYYGDLSALASGDMHFVFGLLDLRQGNIESARQNLSDLALKIDNIDHWIDREDLQFCHGLLAAEIYLVEGNISNAISSYKELLHPAVYSHTMWDNYPFVRDVVARAYVANGDTAKAIAEYEKLITFDPTSTNRSLIHPKYHYRLGLLYERTGRVMDAVREYKKFAEYWKIDSKDDPISTDAKRRLKSLQQYVN